MQFKLVRGLDLQCVWYRVDLSWYGYFVSPPVRNPHNLCFREGSMVYYHMRAQASATKALREIVAEAGLQPEEYALHSLGVGGATRL